MKRILAILVLACLPLVTSAQSPEQKKATVAYLQALETKEGGFLPSPKAKVPSLRATSSSLRALKYFGGSASNLEGCKKFVLSCRDDKTGGFADTPGGMPDVVVTAVGLMAMVELKLPTEKVEKAAIAYLADNAKQFEQVRMAAAGLEAIGKSSEKNADWLKRLALVRNLDGTYGRGKGLARETGGAVACYLRLGGKVEDKDAILRALNTHQREDGGFGMEDKVGSDLESSYRVLRTYVMLKAKPKRADDLKAFVAQCRNRDGGYAVTPGGESSVGGTYFAGIILHWLSDK